MDRSSKLMSHRGWRNWVELTLALSKREIEGRYRGSLLGIAWTVATPLLMLGVFTFVFGAVLQTRWPHGGNSTQEFALILFSGLSLFSFTSEVLSRAPNVILTNVNYIKKVVFPLEVLPIAMVASALFHAAMSILILVAGVFALRGFLPAAAAWLPLMLIPFVLLNLGLAWFLAALGVYVRDTAQIMGTLVTALMFLSPIFYPAASLPRWLWPILLLNPVAFPIEQIRNALVWGAEPDLAGWVMYATCAVMIAFAGWTWFSKTRKGFADVV